MQIVRWGAKILCKKKREIAKKGERKASNQNQVLKQQEKEKTQITTDNNPSYLTCRYPVR